MTVDQPAGEREPSLLERAFEALERYPCRWSREDRALLDELRRVVEARRSGKTVPVRVMLCPERTKPGVWNVGEYNAAFLSHWRGATPTVATVYAAVPEPAKVHVEEGEP